jgi:hypothetical protein
MDPKAVRASLMASEGVEAVVQNRVVRIAQAHGTASKQNVFACCKNLNALLLVLKGGFV